MKSYGLARVPLVVLAVARALVGIFATHEMG
jgi:hypothetical protein